MRALIRGNRSGPLGSYVGYDNWGPLLNRENKAHQPLLARPFLAFALQSLLEHGHQRMAGLQRQMDGGSAGLIHKQ